MSTESSMKLTPFKKLAAMSKDKLREVMAIPRAARMKAQANLEMADLDMEIQNLKGKIEESFADENSYKDFNFRNLFETYDEIAVLQYRKEQYAEALEQLFPENEDEEKSDAA